MARRARDRRSRLPREDMHAAQLNIPRAARAAASGLLLAALPAGAALPLSSIELPPGFEISIYADHVPGARGLALGDRGTLFVGTSREGKVYAIAPHEAGEKVKPLTIAHKLQTPNGVAFKDGTLYVAERSRILRFDDIEDRLDSPPAPLIVFDQLPKHARHGLRAIRFGPDGLLYISVGAPCDVCMPGPQQAQIIRIDLGIWPLKAEIVAEGVRNSLGFDWDPRTQNLWFTDNGPEHLGGDEPVDELDHASGTGLNFGYPFCHGGQWPDPLLGQQRDCSEFVPPVRQLALGTEPLGMLFYTGDQFPEQYRNAIFIAEHGSVAGKPEVGFRVSVVTFDGERDVGYEPFAKGWLRGRNAWGRPADIVMAPDGALLVSDDKAGVVYRIGYRQP